MRHPTIRLVPLPKHARGSVEVRHGAHRRLRTGFGSGRAAFITVPVRCADQDDRVEVMSEQAINLREKVAMIGEQWSPRVSAEMNDYPFKLVRIQGEFIWHDHPDTDDTFLVVEGRLRIDFEDGAVELGAGDLYVVPKGHRHKPSAREEAKVLLIKPRGVLNTGREGADE